MMKIAVPVSILAALMLGACASSNRPATGSSAAATPQQMAQQTHYRAGTGVVQSAAPAPSLASAGGTTPGGTMQRLGIRMDDGSMLYVDTPSTEFSAGTRVRLTENREIVRQ